MPSFSAPTAFDLGAAPNAVAVGHFEGAGAPLDVVTANANGTVSVLLGKGDGTLQNPISITVGGSPDTVAVGDFLGKGLQGIVAANAHGTVDVVLSNGNGTFQTPKAISIGATPVGVAVGDFNRDGKLDIVTANSNGTVTFLPGKGDGTFLAPLTSTPGGSLTSVAAGDFNGDGKLDLVVGTSTGLDILLGKGDGTFQLKQTVSFARIIHGIVFQGSASAVAVSDLRGNGKQDVVALSSGDAVVVLLGNGDGTVQNPVTQAAGQAGTASFAIGDFNGDGKPDIATSSLTGYAGPPSVIVLVGKGDGTFQAGPAFSVGETATALAAGAFRGNGKLDLVMASNQATTSVTLLPGNGNATFATVPTVASTNAPYFIAAADFNGDGKPDLVTAGIGNVNVLLNNGDGTFHAGASLAINGVATALAVGDFTGNGKQDIAVASGNDIDIFLGNGNGTFQAPKLFSLSISDSIVSMVVGNFVHGGLPGLALKVQLSLGTVPYQIMVLKNKGNGVFVQGQTINLAVDIEGLATADLNGDGKLDLVTTTMLADGTRDVDVFLGKGDGTFQAAITTPTGFSPFFVAAGDFRGIGKPDLVLVDYFDVDNVVLVMQGNGNGTFQKPLVFKFRIPLGFATPAVGDFFGDGKLGFAVATGLGQVTVFRGNGDGTFQAPVSFLTDFTGSQPNALAAADFNGDGKLDLAVTNYSDDAVSVLLNTSPPPSHAAPVATTTTLTADTTTSVFGQPVTLTATVTVTTGTATGSVIFFDGSTMLGEVALDPNGQARLLVQLATGTHSLTAVLAGIAPFTDSTSAALSETVNKDATTTTVSVGPIFGSDVFVNFAVTPVTPGSGVPTGTVTIRDGSTVIATADASLGYVLVRLGAGTHHLTVSYCGDANFLPSISDTLVLTIG